MQTFINYLKDTAAELKRVSWPTRKQATIYTTLVVVVSIIVAIYIGVFDYVFSEMITWFITPS